MKLSGLSFSVMPPLTVPFRYFISAALMVMVLAGFIFFAGPDPWLSRWHPAMLSITHGFTLGFITTVMMGALLQLLPVVGGVGIPKARLVGGACHLLHVVGSIALMLAFVWPAPQQLLLMQTALGLLLTGFSLYLAAVTWVLLQKLSQGVTINAIRLAVLALAVTVVLGGLLLSRNLGADFISGHKVYTNLHVFAGLAGWIAVLIIGVSFQVVPMFHVAPDFPKWLTRFFPVLMLTLLSWLFWRGVTNGDSRVLTEPVLLLLLLNSLFAVVLLRVISRRKRKVPDNTLDYWRLSAISLFVITGVFLIPENYLPEPFNGKKAMWLTAAYLYFYVLSVIQGLLLKILPFLSYNHLQQQCLTNFQAMQYLPNMHELLPKKHGRLLFIGHILTGISLLATVLFPGLYWLFALLLLIEFSGLFYLMIRTLVLYLGCKTKMAQLELAAR
ncbi:hypothetical protein SG34_018435 [Thalassomonas viridans]|uniref:Uncharacterized protein n=1 Tax=Thalassomonas viridans TaxID=137584 RepID=A0AAE9YZQ2_9GAMM|nr:hypothetical protein [Thalassomonas viridans]WDE03369.1 hypothetical protein SG34_018435 [Thalassomonas viridans]